MEYKVGEAQVYENGFGSFVNVREACVELETDSTGHCRSQPWETSQGKVKRSYMSKMPKTSAYKKLVSKTNSNQTKPDYSRYLNRY